MRLRNLLLAGFFLGMLVFFSSAALQAQQTINDYTPQWKKIDNLVSNGLTRSALEEVEKIYRTSKKYNNDPQLIKALIYKINLQQGITEDASAKSIDSMEQEIKVSGEPARSILESMTAQLFWNYFQQNRYKLYQRTNTNGFDKKDIATWTADDLHRKIGQLFLASLEQQRLLQRTKLDPFDAIIVKGNARYLRPTLYDLLAHRALEYFRSDESDISRPAYAFEIKDSTAFAPAGEFIQYRFVTNDSSSLHHKALLIFQDLLAFHLRDPKPDALIDADMERIQFVNQYGIMSNKDTLYIHALQNISDTYPGHPASAQAAFLVAQMVYNYAFQASKNNIVNANYSVKKARKLLEEIAQTFPGSEGGINAVNLITRIEHPEINLTIEKVNVPGLPFRTLVTFKNYHTIYFRLIELSPPLKKEISSNAANEQIFHKLTQQKSSRSWKQDLPATDDYLTHSVEVKIDALPLGEYILLGSASPDFSLVKNPLAAATFYVSNISYVNSNRQYFVLDRTSGQPMEGALVQVYRQTYHYNTRNFQFDKKEQLTTDNHGFFNLPPQAKNENNAVRLNISYRQDHLFLDDLQYNYNYYDEANQQDIAQKDFDKVNSRFFLFTDRSIYRPGQLVFFKGIGIANNLRTKKTMLLPPGDSLTIFLSDANSRRIDSLKVVLNDFGSFNGKFRLPENKLNGIYGIDVGSYNNSTVDFSVEEYKRPKFYTGFEKMKESYRVGDTVDITGFAKAYSGNNIDGAKVSYRVTRQARFFYPWMFWRKGLPRSGTLEITHGETTADAGGRFTLSFAAIPDLSIDKNTDPVFDYRVEADVTDINGETRSAEMTVPIGYKALNLQIALPNGDIVNSDSLKNMIITSKNLGDQPETVKAEVTIYKLRPPERMIRKRLWSQPDTAVLTRDAFIQYFPHDEYTDETEKEAWPRVGSVFHKSDSTNNSDNWLLPKEKFQQGWYVIEANAKDKYGQNVQDVKYFQAYDKKAASLPAPAYLWDFGEEDAAEPGDTGHLVTGTTANDVFLIEEIIKQNTYDDQKTTTGIANHEFNFIKLNNERKTFYFPISEKDRGGFGVCQFFVKDNRLYVLSKNVQVPWSNKELGISFDTFRDKTLPGSEEKWKVTISGYKGEKLAAEMLASMYDASLDQFKPHAWNTPDVWPAFSFSNPWTGNQNFTSVQSLDKYWSEPYVPQKEKTYDALLYFNNRIFTGVKDAITFDRQFTVPMPAMVARESKLNEVAIPGYATKSKADTASGYSPIERQSGDKTMDPSRIQIRKNFNETAFFYPDLRTDKAGNISFCFIMPEALTEWKMMALAHTRELATGYATKTVITQKDLMVQPNAPRFFREGDSLEFSAKIVNTSDKPLSGQAEFHLLDASTLNPADGPFNNVSPLQPFTVAAGQSTLVTFKIDVPENYHTPVVYRIVARSGDVSDGEEAAIPVVTNRILVTETMPLPMRGDGKKDFTFQKLLNSGKSATLTNFGLTVEYTTNPVWYAIQALPYLMEYPYECAEQTFDRFYANSIATKIISSSPKIQAVFERWKNIDTAALYSNLQKNEELKSVLLQETPWVVQAQSEEQQKKNIALLFDMDKMSLQLESALSKLTDMQSPNGGFVWFKGGPEDRFMTQYIVAGIGHLKKLDALPSFRGSEFSLMLRKAISYLDHMLEKDYDDLVTSKSKLRENHLSSLAIQCLYMRSFFPEFPISKEDQTAFTFYHNQCVKYWLSQNKYTQAMIALALFRTNDTTTARAIMKSLRENSIYTEESGMYWKEWNHGGYWWYQAPIESQAMMIEAFSDIENDPKTIGDLKTWLLKNKQTIDWKTTKATAEACYALLLQGTHWLAQEKAVVITLGNTTFNSNDEKKQAGTGYFKRKITGNKVTPEMGNISVTVSAQKGSSAVSPSGKGQEAATDSWGSVYWQYFENLDKITFSETPLKLAKTIFIEKNTDKGPVLQPIKNGDTLRVGDKIKVRIELRVDRNMEYVHMKDMRSSCMEPTNVLSEYKYQGGLGYYETTQDVSTSFFFGYVNRGTYVFEYPLFVSHAGSFSNGITTIQCMYAPEFAAHSEGIRLHVAP